MNQTILLRLEWSIILSLLLSNILSYPMQYANEISILLVEWVYLLKVAQESGVLLFGVCFQKDSQKKE